MEEYENSAGRKNGRENIFMKKNALRR